MVDRQYDTMRRDRIRLAEDPNNAKGPPKPEDSELVANTAPTANGATEAPVSEQEVRTTLILNRRYLKMYIRVNFSIQNIQYRYH